MWHDLKQVAETQKLNTEEFVQFAITYSEKYGICKEQVSTWYVDSLVEDFKTMSKGELKCL